MGKRKFKPNKKVRKIPRAPREKTEKTYLRGYNSISSTAGGVISPIYISSDPFTLGIQGFSQFAALYRTYRVLKIVVLYTPNTAGAVNNVLVTGSPIIHGTVRKASSPAASYSDVQGDQGCTLTSSNMVWVHKASAIFPDEKLFVSTGVAPTNIFAIETFGSGFAASTNFASTLVTYKIEFASRFF